MTKDDDAPKRRECTRRATDDSQQLDIQAPGGFKLNLKGGNQAALMVALAVVIGGGILYKLVEHSTASAAANESSTASIVRLEKTTKAMIYVLALTPEQREKLQLQKPDEIRQMEREAR